MGLQGRISLEENEGRSLARFAEFSCRSRGRSFEEPIYLYQTDFQLDRERIIGSRAFAQLEHKSKLMLPSPTGRFRSRLAHAISTASLGRSVARSLRLNEDLVEAVALGRDLGCPPFGKAGCHTLNQLMRDHGGFHPAAQSRRIVDEIEMVFPQFNGLNLSWETREGIWRLDSAAGQPSLEAQVVECAHDLVSVSLDLTDALDAGLVNEEILGENDLWTEALAKVNEHYSRMERTRKRRLVLHQLAETLRADLALQSADNLDAANPADGEAARREPRRLIGFSIEVISGMQNLSDLLEQHLHHHSEIARASQRATEVVQELFAFYRKNTHLIDDRAQLKIKKEGVDRAVCDFLSGQSDAEMFRAYARHVGTEELLAELMPKPRES
ncbi:MAG: deoxyguanosinetriphosphate triphosphohydrolase [Candidatus Methylacidiphilales bacterium]